MTAGSSKVKRKLTNFRRVNPRIDYYPGGDAQQAIKRVMLRNPRHTRQDVLDALICAGAKQLALKEN